jgi:hypothetical protein
MGRSSAKSSKYYGVSYSNKFYAVSTGQRNIEKNIVGKRMYS